MRPASRGSPRPWGCSWPCADRRSVSTGRRPGISCGAAAGCGWPGGWSRSSPRPWGCNYRLGSRRSARVGGARPRRGAGNCASKLVGPALARLPGVAARVGAQGRGELRDQVRRARARALAGSCRPGGRPGARGTARPGPWGPHPRARGVSPPRGRKGARGIARERVGRPTPPARPAAGQKQKSPNPLMPRHVSAHTLVGRRRPGFRRRDRVPGRRPSATVSGVRSGVLSGGFHPPRARSSRLVRTRPPRPLEDPGAAGAIAVAAVVGEGARRARALAGGPAPTGSDQPERSAPPDSRTCTKPPPPPPVARRRDIRS